MKDHIDLRIARVERELSRLGALVSLAADEVAITKMAAMAAEEKLVTLQAEIEQLYMGLAQPFSTATD